MSYHRCVPRQPIRRIVILLTSAAVLCTACRLDSYRPPDAVENTEEYGYVVHVDDGDSFVLKDGRRIRMIGVDCFETHENDKLFRDARRTGRDVFWMMRWGRAAGRYTRRMLLHRWVRLAFDQQRHDRYGRVLAYVFIPVDSKQVLDEDDIVMVPRPQQGREIFFNATLIKKGLARTLFIEPNVQYKSLFERLQEQARRMKKGFWKEWETTAEGLLLDGMKTCDLMTGVIERIVMGRLVREELCG